MSVYGGFCFEDNKFSQYTEKQQALNLKACVFALLNENHKDMDWGYITVANHKNNTKCVLVYEIEDISLENENGEEVDWSPEEKCEFVILKAVELDNQLEELKSQLIHSFTYSDKEEQQANKQLLKIVMRILSRQIQVLDDIENYKKILLEDLERYEDWVDKNILRNVVKTVIQNDKTEHKLQETNQGTYIEIAESMKIQLEHLNGILSHFNKCNYWCVELNNLVDFTDVLLVGLENLKNLENFKK